MLKTSVAQVFSYEDDRMAMVGAQPLNPDVVADAVGRLAIVADAVSLARRVEVETLGIDRGCR